MRPFCKFQGLWTDFYRRTAPCSTALVLKCTDPDVGVPSFLPRHQGRPWTARTALRSPPRTLEAVREGGRVRVWSREAGRPPSGFQKCLFWDERKSCGSPQPAESPSEALTRHNNLARAPCPSVARMEVTPGGRKRGGQANRGQGRWALLGRNP